MDIKLYSATGSNSSERIEWLLNYKQLTYQRIEVESSLLTSGYLSINPFGFVPAISVNGFVISESMAIAEYLEELCNDKCLLGRSFEERARIRQICEFVNSSIHAPQNRTALNYWRPNLDEEKKTQLRGKWISQCLSKLEQLIFQESSYAIGTSFTLADIFVASIYKKALQHGSAKRSEFDNHLNWLRSQQEILLAEPKVAER